VTVEGRSLHRFLAQDVPATAVVTIALPRAVPNGGNRTLLVIVGGAVIAALITGVLFVRTRRPVAPPPNAAS
jgi:hypothetical protein